MRFVPELDRALVLEATRRTHALWGDGRPLADYQAYTLHQLDLAGPELFHYAGLVDEAGVVASMKRYALAISAPDGSALPAVGIGAVFTREDARSLGAGTRLLREILDEARALGLAAAWLHAEIDPAFYARRGFLELPASSFRAPAAALPEAGALEMRPAEPGDLDRMLAWYDAGFSSAAWMRPARTAAMWRFFTFRNALRAWILADEGAEVGYLVGGRARGDEARTLWVDEWSAPHVARDRIWATLRAFAAREATPEVAGWLRPDHAGPPFIATARVCGAAQGTVPMIALLEPRRGPAAWTPGSIAPAHTHFGSFEYF